MQPGQFFLNGACLTLQHLKVQLPVGEGAPQFLLAAAQLLQTSLPLGDLSGDGVRPVLLLVQFSGKALGVVLVVLHLVLQNSDGRLPLAGVCREVRKPDAQLIRFNIQLPHLGGQLLGAGVEFLLRTGCLVPLAGGLFKIAEQLPVVLTEPVQILHPDGDLQSTQFVPVEQKLLGLGCLLPQRLYL